MQGMNTESHAGGARRAAQVLSVLAAAAGAKLSYDFGVQIGGPPVGVLVAASGALFGWLMVGAFADQLRRWRERRRKHRS